ncbi:OmpA family outer membrane lipoprotein [Vibrio maritimus]|uniref:OmpA family outer membrane lipoprotein n=1 Tax=Vibrio maritimus TaxID=990268 RepID=A0A090T3A3_9VIBR|nr:OmpA family outer membrane lipoprotein [Vibrio maritimus]
MIRLALFTHLTMIGLLIWPTVGFAQKYIVPFDAVQWQFESRVDRCILAASDPHTGFRVQFSLVASQPLEVGVEKRGVRALPKSTSFNTTEPVWGIAKSYSTTTIENVRQRGTQLVTRDGADLLLADMAGGAWFNVNAMDFDVYFPTTHFNRALSEFNQCRFALPPVNFQHARQVELLFARGSTQLTATQKQIINDISALIKRDNKIVRVLIDGYTDNSGDSVANLQISKQRGSDVAEWFVENGVSKSMIEIRGHGDRYPKYDNATPEGRDKNRRVEIRLVRK